jgi:hypothetical protein
MTLDFNHIQAAHCENGVTTSLLRHAGVQQITEPLAFGIGAGLFFVYIPFFKINNGPIIAFRTLPGLIFNRTCKALDIPVVRKKFYSKEAAEQFLNERLAEGHPVGCQVGVYYLPYFPKEYRFHFNAHNIIVFGNGDGNYQVSDPVMEGTNIMTPYELERVRFAKGALAPKGQLYYPKEHKPVTDEQIKRGIISGIKKNAFNMLMPGPIAGINGIRFAGKRIKKWRDNLGPKEAGLYLAQLVRMQEEIGTGGGGFRYIYGAFLQEAQPYTNQDELLEIAQTFTESGDLWRTAAVHAAGIYKGRLGSQEDFNTMSDYLLEVAEIEKKAFTALKNIKWR